MFRTTYKNESEVSLTIENITISTYLLHIKTKEGTAVKKLIKTLTAQRWNDFRG